MTINSYPDLSVNLSIVSPDGNLYARITGKALEYYNAQKILENAKGSKDPRQTQFQEQADGRFQDLQMAARAANSILSQHHLGLPLLSTDKNNLEKLAEEIALELSEQ